MENPTRKNGNEQKKENKPSFHEQQKSEKEKLKQLENELIQKKADFGFDKLSWEELPELAVESLVNDYGHAKASEIIDLQKSYKAYLEQKQSFESIIFLEPSKLPEILIAVEKLLLNNPEHHIYQRSGKLVRITKVSDSPQTNCNKIKRSHDALIIKEIDQAFLTVHLTKIGKFFKPDGQQVDCPERIARYFLAAPKCDIPVLTGIINGPTLRSDGTILDKPGYDVKSGMLFFPGEYEFTQIPQQPTFNDAISARDQILYVLKGFPFEDEASESVALAAILSALIRSSISTAPLFGFTAPKMASGKSLLADVVALIATGKSNSVIAQADNEAEEKKRIMAILLEGDPIICYDNVEKPFKSAALCSILTQSEYKDRILGVSESRTVPTNATFLVTGNNLVFSGDISTRTLLCKLDPQVEHPEERAFDINLRVYIPQNRERLVVAGLTILRAYHIAGKPQQNIKPFGRFEEWSEWIRSAILWIGMADPYDSRKGIENSDPIRIALCSLFSIWYEMFKDEAIKVKDLIVATVEHGDVNSEALHEVLMELAPDRKGGINKNSLGKKLAQYKNRIEGGFRLEQNGTYQGSSLWRVRKVEN